MKKSRFDLGKIQGDIFSSEEMFKRHIVGDPTLDVNKYADWILKRVFKSFPEAKEYISVWGKVNSLSGLAILDAHGSSNGKWTYSDSRGDHEINRWIGRMDSKYSGLIIDVCNPGTHAPTSRKSVVMFPDRDVNTRAHTSNTETKPACYTLYVPEIGEVNSMVVEYELRQLKKRLKCL